MIRRLSTVSPLLRRAMAPRPRMGISLATRSFQTTPRRLNEPVTTPPSNDASGKYRVVMAVRDPTDETGEIKEFVTESDQLLEPELNERQRERLKDAYQLMFKCKVCSTSNSHTVSKQAYNHGTVLVECPGCKNRHLIADHLKIFGQDQKTLEEILASKGQKVTYVNLNDLADAEATNGTGSNGSQ